VKGKALDAEAHMTDQRVEREFNIEGLCNPAMHYMVDPSAKIETIVKKYVSRGKYFTINRSRQFGKTTTLSLLARRLYDQYVVLRLSFEGKDFYFDSFKGFCENMSLDFMNILKSYNSNDNCKTLAEIWERPIEQKALERDFKMRILEMCAQSDLPVVLMIDEVDRATDFDVFVTFLGLLREMYLERSDNGTPTFQSVLLAGVHDVKNLKKKIRPDSEYAYNSPWNIAAKFDVDMSFSATEIAAMLEEYEADHHTGMDIPVVAERLRHYSGGYPFLVSCLCKTIDESEEDAPLEWTVQGVDESESRLVKEMPTLFEDVTKNVLGNEKLGTMVKDILLHGEDVQFQIANPTINLGSMYGIFVQREGKVAVANVIFETILYDLFLSLEEEDGRLKRPCEQKSKFVQDGVLDFDKVVSRFAAFLKSEYKVGDGTFLEEHARLLFLGFVKPIINGAGHYAVESRTRNNRRMDIVFFYGKEKYIVELKIWRGEKYEQDGLDQLADYLESQEQTKGWLISFAPTREAPKESRTFQHRGFTINETVIAYRAP
jgi:hypothetical protein